MNTLIFCTGNDQKFALGGSVCAEYGIRLTKHDAEIDEVQSEDTDYVAQKKAEAAFVAINKPVVISDDAWIIPALNGFPGTYAKSVNTWFSPADYIRLTKDLDDRRITLRQTLVYRDDTDQKLFSYETTGKLLTEARGKNGVSLQKVISFEPDGRSISEMIGDDTHDRNASTLKVWHEFASWYTGART